MISPHPIAGYVRKSVAKFNMWLLQRREFAFDLDW